MHRAVSLVASIAITICLASCGKNDAITATPAAPAQSKSEIIDLERILPPNELRVITAINDYAARYSQAENELQKSTILTQRNSAIQKAAKSQKGESAGDRWIGVLEQMGTTSEGNAYIVVRVAPNITLSTWNNEFSDISDNTLIKHRSKNYETLSNLKTGSVIRFGFNFDVRSKGLTEKGKMIDPEFATTFSHIEPLDAAAIRKLAGLDK